MKKLLAKLASASLITMMALFLAPTTYAAPVNCDADSDGYVALTQSMLEEVVQDNAFQSNGNYSPDQWKVIFDTYSVNLASDPGLDDSYRCANLNFKKGAEPSRCDKVVIDPNSNVYDSSKVTGSVQGSRVNPGAFDTPDDGIDQDCDGADGKFVTGGPGAGADLGGLVNRSITLLGRAVVVISVVILIWGGILYATAAGDEAKTSKARKAIIGAIIGLLVGLLAPAIVNYITASIA